MSHLKDPQTGETRHCEACDRNPATGEVETEHGAADCCDSLTCRNVLKRRLARQAHGQIIGETEKVIAGEKVVFKVHGDGSFSCTPRRKQFKAGSMDALVKEVDEYLRKLALKKVAKPVVPFIGMKNYGPTFDGSYCGVDFRDGSHIFKMKHPHRREMVNGQRPELVLLQSGSRTEVDRLAKAVKDAQAAYDEYTKKHARRLGTMPYVSMHQSTHAKQERQEQGAAQVREATEYTVPEDGGSDS